MSSLEIEDVLASIRRLVSDDLRPANRAASGKLILTPALRVVARAEDEDQAPEPAQHAPDPAQHSNVAVLADDWVPDRSTLDAVSDADGDHLEFGGQGSDHIAPKSRSAMESVAEAFHDHADEFILSMSDSGDLVLGADAAPQPAEDGQAQSDVHSRGDVHTRGDGHPRRDGHAQGPGAVFAVLTGPATEHATPAEFADAEGGVPVEDDTPWSVVGWDDPPGDDAEPDLDAPAHPDAPLILGFVSARRKPAQRDVEDALVLDPVDNVVFGPGVEIDAHTDAETPLIPGEDVALADAAAAWDAVIAQDDAARAALGAEGAALDAVTFGADSAARDADGAARDADGAAAVDARTDTPLQPDRVWAQPTDIHVAVDVPDDVAQARSVDALAATMAAAAAAVTDLGSPILPGWAQPLPEQPVADVDVIAIAATAQAAAVVMPKADPWARVARGWAAPAPDQQAVEPAMMVRGDGTGRAGAAVPDAESAVVPVSPQPTSQGAADQVPVLRGDVGADAGATQDFVAASDADAVTDMPATFVASPRRQSKAAAAAADIGWADRAEAEIHRQLAHEMGLAVTSEPLGNGLALTVSETALRDLVRDMIRDELSGKLGERITQNVRVLVQAELQRTMAVQVHEFRSARTEGVGLDS